MSGKSRRAEHAADTRRALLDAARWLYSRRGYAATSLDDVCRRARVTKGALYHHFQNKEELFLAVLEQVENDVVRAGAGAVDPQADVWEKVRAAAHAFLDACARSKHRRIVLEAPAVLGWRRCRDFEAGYVVRLLGTALDAAAARGQVRSEHPKLLAQLLVALFNEAAMMVAEADDPQAARRAVVRELDTVIAGLRSTR